MARRQFDQEENRLEYGHLLFPEPDYDLDFAVGMTYSLDMEALLGVPVSLGMLEDLDGSAAQNPFFLLEAIRKSSDNIAIFCNADGIKLPQNIRPVYALLENSIFPIGLGQKANFHPKLWIIRYKSERAAPMIKVIVPSRNLTFDRSLDIAVEMTGYVEDLSNEAHRPLADMLSFVTSYANDEKQKKIRALARDVLHVPEFDCGDQYEQYLFLPFGIPRYKNKAESLLMGTNSLIVVSPFLTESVVAKLTESPQQKVLITRRSSVTQRVWNCFQKVYVLREALLSDEVLETADAPGTSRRDLHAKVYFKTDQTGNYLYLGSLNASANAFYHNVEFLLELKFKPYYASFNSVLKDLVPDKNCAFECLEAPPEETILENDEESMDILSDVIYALGTAKAEKNGERYSLTLTCAPIEKAAEIAPLFRKGMFRPIREQMTFDQMLLKELSEFYIIRRGTAYALAKVETVGIPTEERDNAIYNEVVGSKSGFLAYVAFLLADDFTEAALEQHDLLSLLEQSNGTASKAMQTALYERLLRSAAEQPERLNSVVSVMEKMDPELVDDSFRKLIETFQSAVGRRKR